MSEHEKATPRPWKVVCGSRGSVHESRPYQIVGIDGKAVSSWGVILRRAAALIEQMRDALKEHDTTLADEELIAAAEKFLKEGQ